MSPGDSGRGAGRGSRFPQEEERILREEEQRLLREEDRQLMREDDRGVSAARVDGNCANHPDVEATAACTECARQLCAQCVFASGGGHSFCKECMDSARLVDAEPQIIGQVVESRDVREGVGPKIAVLVLFVVLALVALSLAAIFAIGALL